jgi:hypothetical protein
MQLRILSGSHDEYMRITMPLVSDHDGDVRCIGTAFLAAPGLALTAQHVVEDWLTYQESRDGYKRRDATFSAAAFQLYGEVWYPWAIDVIYLSRIADIAFLRLRRPAWWGNGPGQIEPPYATLSFNPPEPGAIVRLFGFPSSSVEGGVLVVHPSESRGTVRQAEFQFPNIGFRPRSYLELAGSLDAGMSGGPCFDSSGDVVGVNVKGCDGIEGDPIAYVALLWPAMTVEIDLFQTGSFPVGELFTKGMLHAVGYRRLHLTKPGRVRLSKVDPESLRAIPNFALPSHLVGAANFATDNTRQALLAVKTQFFASTGDGLPLDSNQLHTGLRAFFWELEAAIRTSVALLGRKIGLSSPAGDWNEIAPTCGVYYKDGEAVDQLALLDAEWNGIDLFEVRTYAEWCRLGPLPVECVISSKGHQLSFAALRPCRAGSAQLILPDGLDRYLATAELFVQRALYLANRAEHE